MKILVVGDIVGSPGRRAFARVAGQWKHAERVDLAIANAENAAGGRGLTAALAEELFNAGADVITLGDHAWDQKELIGYLEREPRVLRPANFPPACPGKGWITVDTPKGRVTVISLVGRVFMPPNDCPFRAADTILGMQNALGKVVLVDIHAEATSEKIALGHYLDGRVTAVFGSHTHVQTSDETLLEGGTAYITDLGMTGPKNSVLGRDYPSVMKKFLTGMPSSFKVAKDNVQLEGIVLDVNTRTGKARRIKRVREYIDRDRE